LGDGIRWCACACPMQDTCKIRNPCPNNHPQPPTHKVPPLAGSTCSPLPQTAHIGVRQTPKKEIRRRHTLRKTPDTSHRTTPMACQRHPFFLCHDAAAKYATHPNNGLATPASRKLTCLPPSLLVHLSAASDCCNTGGGSNSTEREHALQQLNHQPTPLASQNPAVERVNMRFECHRHTRQTNQHKTAACTLSNNSSIREEERPPCHLGLAVSTRPAVCIAAPHTLSWQGQACVGSNVYI
jgi:hypothetical protein